MRSLPARSKTGRKFRQGNGGPVYLQNARIAVTGIAMLEIEVEDGAKVEISPEQLREQLELLVRDHSFRKFLRRLTIPHRLRC